MKTILYLHLIAATVWVGGLIVLASLVPAVRKVTPDRTVLQAIARRFGRVSWVALAVLVTTGLWMVSLGFGWSNVLITKVSIVGVTAAIALWHSLAARNQSPAVRGILQSLVLVLSLVIVALAINV